MNVGSCGGVQVRSLSTFISLCLCLLQPMGSIVEYRSRPGCALNAAGMVQLLDHITLGIMPAFCTERQRLIHWLCGKQWLY